MKKIMICILTVLSITSLTACRTSDVKKDMYIEKAQLTEQEKNITNLLGMDSQQLIYDFTVDDSVKCIQINTYELTDGKWTLISGGGGLSFTDRKGRIALGFKNIEEGLRIAVQSDGTGSSASHTARPVDDSDQMARTTSMLSDSRDISYEQDIPLAVQIATSQDRIQSYDVEYYYTPEEYVKHNYEHVYAITVRFSQKTLDELDAGTT